MKDLWSRELSTLKLGFILTGSVGRLKILPFALPGPLYTLHLALCPRRVTYTDCNEGCLACWPVVRFSLWEHMEDLRGKGENEVEVYFSRSLPGNVLPGWLDVLP